MLYLRGATVHDSKESKIYSDSKSAENMARELGYYRIYDAGAIKYTMNLAA